MYTFHFAAFRIRRTLDRLTSLFACTLIHGSVATPQHWKLDLLLSLLIHVKNSTVGFKFIPNTGNCSTCWWLSSKLILPLSLYLFNVFLLPVPLQYSLALLKGQIFSHCCCRLPLAARTRHDTHVTHVKTSHYITAQEL
jgi:hypothetical protein